MRFHAAIRRINEKIGLTFLRWAHPDFFQSPSMPPLAYLLLRASAESDGRTIKIAYLLARSINSAPLGERQEPTGEGCILGLFGHHAKLRASEVSAKGDRGGHDESPSFVMVNHTAAYLKTPRKSASGRRGISEPMLLNLGASL